MKFYTEFGEKLLKFTDVIKADSASEFVSGVKSVALIVLVTLILYRLTQVMLGSTKKPVSDISVEILVWAFLWLFAFNAAYLGQVQNAIIEAYNFFGGGISFFNKLDEWWEKLIKVGELLNKKDDDVFAFRGAIAVFIVTIAGAILTLVPFTIIIMTSIILNLLIAMAPFMILSLIFPAIKQIFYNWVEMILSIFIIMLIVSLIQKSVSEMVSNFTEAIASDSSEVSAGAIIGEAFEVLIASFVVSVLFYYAVPLGKSIAGASASFGLEAKGAKWNGKFK